MAEIGIDIRAEFPKPWTDEVVRAADVVVTMGCGDACPLYPGKRYEDWELADPAGRGGRPHAAPPRPPARPAAGSTLRGAPATTGGGGGGRRVRLPTLPFLSI